MECEPHLAQLLSWTKPGLLLSREGQVLTQNPTLSLCWALKFFAKWTHFHIYCECLHPVWMFLAPCLTSAYLHLTRDIGSTLNWNDTQTKAYPSFRASFVWFLVWSEKRSFHWPGRFHRVDWLWVLEICLNTASVKSRESSRSRLLFLQKFYLCIEPVFFCLLGLKPSGGFERSRSRLMYLQKLYLCTVPVFSCLLGLKPSGSFEKSTSRLMYLQKLYLCTEPMFFVFQSFCLQEVLAMMQGFFFCCWNCCLCLPLPLLNLVSA